MNIAILIPELGGGGAEHVAQRIGNFFVARGHQVYYFLGDFGVPVHYSVKGKIVRTGIRPIYPWRMNSYVLTGGQLWHNAQCIKALKRRYAIDVSISFMEQFNAINVLSRCGDKIIVRVCTILSARSLTGVLYHRRMLHFLYSLADTVVVMARDGQREMTDIYDIFPRKISIIPNPVHLQQKSWEQMRVLRLERYVKKQVLVVGRLEGVKQQDHIIRAFAAVAAKIPEAQLTILGQGPLLAYLKKLADMEHLEDRVNFPGFVEDIQPYLMDASVCVITSKCEGFPNGIIEAMTWAIPIVAADAPGGCRDILDCFDMDQEGVRICPYGIMTPQLPIRKINFGELLWPQEHALAEAMMHILTDEDLFISLAVKSYQRARDYEITKIMELWGRILC
ncbi:glycosyltransferase [Pectinatus frisingensis]|uniref:glycosyltransferase n=1 Tax=Pectinatus frisingensis TaxID=865 RepID=UPI0018C62EDE|nr:glycosyltransferase [Pectinatus frisingensis]